MLLWSAAAVGAPAVLNALIARRNQQLPGAAWGHQHRYAWREGEVAFQRLGSGTPLLLVHSLGPGHDCEEWRGVAESLADRHEVFALDLLGWGRSDKPAIQYDSELYIQLLSDFMADVIREPAAVAGAGLSAAYVVQSVLDQPDAVTAVALIGPRGLGDEEDPDLGDALLHRLLRLPVVGTSALNLYTSLPAIQRRLRREIYSTADRVDAGSVQHHYRSSHQPGSHLALAALLSGYCNHGVPRDLTRVQAPVLLAWGRSATSPPVENADLWLTGLPGATLEVFANTGDLPHLEVPARFAETLGAFLAEDRT